MTVAKRIAGAATLGIGMLVGCGVSVGTAQAGYTVALTQQGLTSSPAAAEQSICSA